MRMMPLKIRVWMPGALAALLAACMALPPPTNFQAPAAPNGAQLAGRGNHLQAAMAYESQALSAAPEARASLALSAAREWLAAQRPADAQRVLRTLLGAPLLGAQRYQRALLGAEVSYQLHHAELAWRQISALPANGAGGAQLDYDTLRMHIALGAGHAVEGIDAEMNAELFTSSEPARVQLRRALLAELLAARARGVGLSAPPGLDPIVRGWLELGATATPSSAVSLNSTMLAARWRARYPNHPALAILDQAFPAPFVAAAPGGRVALLLPLSGPYGAQGITVRDGFLSALFQLPANARPQLHIYDTAAIPIADALAQAHAGGSSFIVGPLVPAAVAAAAAVGPQSVPMLALNFLPDGQAAPPGLFQYALSPEDEAQQVAQRILADGHRHGIILVPRNDWGTRVAGAFARALALGGGGVIAAPSYDPDSHDYGDELRSVLGVDESQQRDERLQRVLGTKFNFEPRHRGDIEFVFIVPYSAVNARLLLPQLRYFYAGDIPSYSISEAYEPDSLDSNRDIAGLMYPDMPWMVSGQSNLSELRDDLSATWDKRTAWQTRLFAFGYDAGQLMLAMSSPEGAPATVQIDGLTGLLHFDADRRVVRELIWVRVDRNGNPRPLPAGSAGNAPSGVSTVTGPSGADAVPDAAPPP
jgi:outer membrane PBP1 activator LpoA protein